MRERPFRCERNIVLLSEKGRFSVREKPASSLELEAESDNEGQVVAEATLVAVAIIGTEGLDSSRDHRVLVIHFLCSTKRAISKQPTSDKRKGRLLIANSNTLKRSQ